MAIVYDVEISVKVKADEGRYQAVTITRYDVTYEAFYSMWPKVLYQTEKSKALLERELAEEKSVNNN